MIDGPTAMVSGRRPARVVEPFDGKGAGRELYLHALDVFHVQDGLIQHECVVVRRRRGSVTGSRDRPAIRRPSSGPVPPPPRFRSNEIPAMTASQDRLGRRSCRLLAAIAAEFETTRPFAGLTIGTGIHLEPKTAALLLTLQRGGADVVSTGNLNSTQPETVDYLRERGIDGDRRADARPGRARRATCATSSPTQPDLLLDNGGDLFARYLEAP